MEARTANRQEAKQRNKLLKDLYLLVEWLNSEDAMVDTLPARDVIPPEGLDILDVKTGDRCQASYKSRYYSVKVAAVGKYADMKTEQSEREKELESSGEEATVSQPELAENVVTEKPSTHQDEKSIDNGPTGEVAKGSTTPKPSKGGSATTSVEVFQGRAAATSAEKTGEVAEGTATPNNVATSKKTVTSKPGKLPKQLGLPTKKPSKGGSTSTSAEKTGEVQNTVAASKKTVASKPGKIPKQGLPTKKPSKGGSTTTSAKKTGEVKNTVALTSVTSKPGKIPKQGLPTKVLGRSPQKRPIRPLISDSPFEESSSEEEDQVVLSSKEAKSTPKKKLAPDAKRLKLSVEDSSDSEEEEVLTPKKQSLEARRVLNISRNEIFKKMIGLSPGLPSNTITSEVTRLKEKLRMLERSHANLKLKVTEQASEINRLVRLTSTEISSASASEVTPEHFRRPAPFHSKSPPSLHSPSQEIKGEPEFLSKVDKLRLANAKLQAEPGNAALKLMDCVFSVEEMVNGNPSGVTKSKDDDRKKTIKPLPAEKMKFINDILQEKWGETVVDKEIRKKMTQKCTDYYNDKRYIHLRCHAS